MRTVYVDTGVFVALVMKQDRENERTARHCAELHRSGARLVTCDAVIAETVTRLRYRAGVSAVKRFRTAISNSILKGTLSIRDGSEILRNEAFDLMEKFADVPLSYPDCIGAAVARAVKTHAVFGYDNDFRILGFALEPH